MASPASIARHPMHPMLVPFPIALWIFSFVSDVIYFLGWGGPIWQEIAFYTMIGGTLGALAAAVPGYIDWRSISDPQVKKIGQAHLIVNLFIVALYAVNLWLRMTSDPGAFPVVLSAVAVSLLGISGWLGGELVYVHGIAVEPESIRKKI
jgi:uncharacterized membrane protein